jgi:hypothetical protein
MYVEEASWEHANLFAIRWRSLALCLVVFVASAGRIERQKRCICTLLLALTDFVLARAFAVFFTFTLFVSANRLLVSCRVGRFALAVFQI